MFRCIRTPLYIECWILLLISLHCMWRCRNLSLLFIHCTVLIRTLQNPTSAVFTIMLHVYVAKSFCRSLTFLWCTLYLASFFSWFWIAGTAKPGWLALSCTLFWPANLYLVKNGRQQTFTVTALLQR